MSEKEIILKVLNKLDMLEREVRLLSTSQARMRGKLLDVKDVMVYLGCCKNTVYKNQDKLGVLRTPAGLRFKYELVDLFLKTERV